MTLKVYEYQSCGTCKKARQFLDSHGITYQVIAIREQGPTLPELEAMLEFYDGSIKKLFNISGQDYRVLGIASKLPHLSKQEALELLAGNGNLVKRPFVIGENVLTVGFNEELWKKLF